jgi:hypothetical protein
MLEAASVAPPSLVRMRSRIGNEFFPDPEKFSESTG